MIQQIKPEARCYQCHGELFDGLSGMVCGDCDCRIIPTEIYLAEREGPIVWRAVRSLGQKAFRRWWGGGETRSTRDAELAKLGLRQTELFR